MITALQMKWVQVLSGGEGKVESSNTRETAKDGQGASGRLGGNLTGAMDAIKKASQDIGEAFGNGPLALSASVGRGGKNKPADVKALQAALNRRANAGLDVDGDCQAKTIAAIKAYQKKLGMLYPDGLIEPGNKTERALNGEKNDHSQEDPAAKGGSTAPDQSKAGEGAGGTGALAALPAKAPLDATPGPIADAMGLQGVMQADSAKGTLKLAGGSKATPNRFVPDVVIADGRKRELAVNGKLTLDLTVRNWAKRPKGTQLDWSVTSSGGAVDFAFDRLEDGGMLTVTGLAAGKGVVKIEVKVVGGKTHKLPDVVLTVSPTAKSASMFVPQLEAPYTLVHEIPIGVEVSLKLKVRNWDKRPKGTGMNWATQMVGDKMDIEIAGRGGEATIKAKGREPGKAVVHVYVSVLGGGTYAFPDTTFAVVKNSDPDSSADMGGVADATNLEQDMHDILQNWQSGAHSGIYQFVTNELSKRIDKLESGSVGSFLASLLGNLVWAAACFTPIGGAVLAFRISVIGIGISTVPAVPHKSKSIVPDIQKLMVDHINEIFAQVNSGLRNNAKALLDAYPGITRFHAMDEFVAASFKPKYFTAKAHHTSTPNLNQSAVRDEFERRATDTLEEVIKADKARRAEEEAKKQMEDMIRQSRRQPGEV